MTEEIAYVVNVKGNQVTLTSQVKSTCSSCSQVDSCANGQVAKALPKKRLTFSINVHDSTMLNSLQADDCVEIGVPERDMLASAFQVYMFPLIGLVTLSLIGQWLLDISLINHELVALSIGAFGGYLGHCFAKYFQNDTLKSDKLKPTILRKIIEPTHM